MVRGPVQIKTRLPIKDCAALFQASMRYNFLKEFMGQGADFQKPPQDNAFGDLDDDPPTFEVQAVLGGSVSDARKSSVTMYAWTRPDHTEVQVYAGKALFSAGVSANNKLQKFVNAVMAADPQAQCIGV